jgi:hypothetical protein
VPYAWGAAYDLLDELNLHPTRTRVRFSARKSGSTQWLIVPSWSEHDVADEVREAERFAKAGGTVVVIGASESVWDALALSVVSKHDKQDSIGPITVQGAWLRAARRIEVKSSALFDEHKDGGSTARVQTAEGAFVMERSVGSGKIVAVADHRFLSNELLGKFSHAPFLVDLVRAYGAPTFDERCHGLMPPRSSLAAFGGGFLLTTALSLSMLTLAALVRARRWPVRMQSVGAHPPPTLDVFVGSLAGLYRARGRREPDAVFRAYRSGFMRRLQRALIGQREVAQVRLEQRMESDAGRLGPAGRWLMAGRLPTTEAELTRAVAALERYLASAKHAKRTS